MKGVCGLCACARYYFNLERTWTPNAPPHTPPLAVANEANENRSRKEKENESERKEREKRGEKEVSEGRKHAYFLTSGQS